MLKRGQREAPGWTRQRSLERNQEIYLIWDFSYFYVVLSSVIQCFFDDMLHNKQQYVSSEWTRECYATGKKSLPIIRNLMLNIKVRKLDLLTGIRNYFIKFLRMHTLLKVMNLCLIFILVW